MTELHIFPKISSVNFYHLEVVKRLHIRPNSILKKFSHSNMCTCIETNEKKFTQLFKYTKTHKCAFISIQEQMQIIQTYTNEERNIHMNNYK